MLTRLLAAALLVLHALDASRADIFGRTRCWSGGNGQPPRWWNEGEAINRGKYWYECRQGRLEPKGCISDNKRLPIGSTVVVGEYVAACETGSDGYLQFRFTACVGSGGRQFSVGEKWVDPQNMYYYQCERDGPYLKQRPKGCMSHDKRRQVPIGGTDDFGDYTYECRQKYDGTIQMCSVGCIHKGKHYKIGEQWPDGEFVYYCKNNGGRCQKVCIGCQHRQKRLYDGDRYHDQGSVYQCEIRPDSFGHKPVACLSKELDGSSIERVIGCRWYLQNSNSKIEQTCELVGTKTVVKTVGCIYRHNGFDTIFLSPGQYTIWNLPMQKKQSVGLACRETSDGAKLDVFDPTQLVQYTQGLKYDQPRGK
ncbi:hypothetical protein Q1695_012429 [Nippostrongylus brasiliensis]|nr:hypothetical protein Q1695_012429 [Nippostrongylus brasiliensis]